MQAVFKRSRRDKFIVRSLQPFIEDLATKATAWLVFPLYSGESGWGEGADFAHASPLHNRGAIEIIGNLGNFLQTRQFSKPDEQTVSFLGSSGTFRKSGSVHGLSVPSRSDD